MGENKYLEIIPEPEPVKVEDTPEEPTEVPTEEPAAAASAEEVEEPAAVDSDSSDSVEPIDETPLDIPTIAPTPIVVPESGFGETEIIAILAIAVVFVVVIGFALQGQQDSPAKGKQSKSEDSSPVSTPRSIVTSTPGAAARDSVSTMSSGAVSIV